MTTNFDSEFAIRKLCRDIINAILIFQLPPLGPENLFNLVVLGCLILMIQMNQFGTYVRVLWAIFYWNNIVKNAFVGNLDFAEFSFGMFANSAIPQFLNAVNEILPPNFKIQKYSNTCEQ